MDNAKIAAAFVKAQKNFAPALKTNTNPAFRSKYVALDGCIEAVIDSLNANGIALLQPTHDCESGVTVETIFLHESGETLSGGKLHVPATKQDAQGYGSALTYARRYSLMAACGIAPEDDDGNAASRPELRPVRNKPTDGAVLTNQQKQRCSDVAMAIQEQMRRDDIVGAFGECQGITDAEEKTYLWSLLSSQIRSAIKKHSDTIKEAA